MSRRLVRLRAIRNAMFAPVRVNLLNGGAARPVTLNGRSVPDHGPVAVILYSKRLAGPAWTKYGVRINTVSPGPVETPILTDFEATMGKDVLDMCRATVGRHGSVDDIAPIIAFLGSPGAGWITGQEIQVDAGFVNSMLAGPPVQL